MIIAGWSRIRFIPSDPHECCFLNILLDSIYIWEQDVDGTKTLWNLNTCFMMYKINSLVLSALYMCEKLGEFFFACLRAAVQTTPCNARTNEIIFNSQNKIKYVPFEITAPGDR